MKSSKELTRMETVIWITKNFQEHSSRMKCSNELNHKTPISKRRQGRLQRARLHREMLQTPCWHCSGISSRQEEPKELLDFNVSLKSWMMMVHILFPCQSFQRHAETSGLVSATRMCPSSSPSSTPTVTAPFPTMSSSGKSEDQ